MDTMASDFLQGTIERLPLPHEVHKHRSFSTSTPFLSQPGLQGSKLRSLSVSVNLTAKNDSGLGSSLADGDFSQVLASPFDGGAPTVTVTTCRTPTSNSNIPLLTGRNCHLSDTPITDKKNYRCRRSLESSFELSDIEESFDQTTTNSSVLNSSRTSKVSDRSFVRRLNLDLDIYDDRSDSYDCCDNAPSLSLLKPVSCLPSVKDSQLVELDILLKQFMPSEPDRLIGRRMGCETVDIIQFLHDLSIPCVSTIITFLSPQDLCRMCQVSRGWKTIIELNKASMQTRKQFLKQLRDKRNAMGKENVGFKRSTRQQRSETPAPLQDLPSLQQPSVSSDSSLTTKNKEKTVSEQFIEVASTLKNDERLQKCPRCRKPAKVLPVQERGQCQNADCGYDFCIKCSYEFHFSKDCVPILTKKTKTDTIGTKKSKKNLKRL